MDQHTTASTAYAVAWISFILAAIALILGWIAFNRTGPDIEDLINQRVQEATFDLREDYNQLEEQVRETAAEGLRRTGEGLQDAAGDVATETPSE